MKTNRLFASIAALGLLSLSSIALAGGPVDRLADRLDLSGSQIMTITALFDAHRETMRSEFGERSERGRPDDETRARLKEARDAFHAEILAVLDAEQAEEFVQMTEQRHERRRGQRRQSR